MEQECSQGEINVKNHKEDSVAKAKVVLTPGGSREFVLWLKWKNSYYLYSHE